MTDTTRRDLLVSSASLSAGVALLGHAHAEELGAPKVVKSLGASG